MCCIEILGLSTDCELRAQFGTGAGPVDRRGQLAWPSRAGGITTLYYESFRVTINNYIDGTGLKPDATVASGTASFTDQPKECITVPTDPDYPKAGCVVAQANGGGTPVIFIFGALRAWPAIPPAVASCLLHFIHSCSLGGLTATAVSCAQ